MLPPLIRLTFVVGTTVQLYLLYKDTIPDNELNGTGTGRVAAIIDHYKVRFSNGPITACACAQSLIIGLNIIVTEAATFLRLVIGTLYPARNFIITILRLTHWAITMLDASYHAEMGKMESFAKRMSKSFINEAGAHYHLPKLAQLARKLHRLSADPNNAKSVLDDVKKMLSRQDLQLDDLEEASAKFDAAKTIVDNLHQAYKRRVQYYAGKHN